MSTRAELAPGNGSGAGMFDLFVREIRKVRFLGLYVAGGALHCIIQCATIRYSTAIISVYPHRAILSDS
jgi:hypothetical protein